jgi:hypothetical protein
VSAAFPTLRSGKPSAIACTLILALASQAMWYPMLSYGAPRQQERQQIPLGSMNSAGEVYVNNSPAPSEATIFSGDSLRTGEHGTATFTISGKGTLKISPNSTLVFTNDPRYVAEVKSGAVVLDSASGPAGITIRTGPYVAVFPLRDEIGTSEIEGTPDGSYLVSCLDGSVSLIPLEGTSGRILQAGQSVIISGEGRLSAANRRAPRPSGSALPAARRVPLGWVILGLAGVGGVAAGVVAAHGASEKQSVSPSTP